METLEPSDLIKIFAVIVLGATGTYLLLPAQPRPDQAEAGPPGRLRPGGAGGPGLHPALEVARGRAGQQGRSSTCSPSRRSAAAILTITSRDPIHSALWFAAVVLATSGLFLLSGAQFLAAGTVIVYAGAIIVTFLFVIMLAQKEGRAIYDRMARSPFWATFASFLLLFGLVYSLVGAPGPAADRRPRATGPRRPTAVAGTGVVPAIDRLDAAPAAHARAGPGPRPGLAADLDPARGRPATAGPFGRHVAGLGGTLYTEHLVTVELAGALLFAALIGALAIATPRAPIRPVDLRRRPEPA